MNRKLVNEATMKELKAAFKGEQILVDLEESNISENMKKSVLVIEVQRAVESLFNVKTIYKNKSLAEKLYRLFSTKWHE